MTGILADMEIRKCKDRAARVALAVERSRGTSMCYLHYAVSRHFNQIHLLR